MNSRQILTNSMKNSSPTYQQYPRTIPNVSTFLPGPLNRPQYDQKMMYQNVPQQNPHPFGMMGIKQNFPAYPRNMMPSNQMNFNLNNNAQMLYNLMNNNVNVNNALTAELLKEKLLNLQAQSMLMSVAAANSRNSWYETQKQQLPGFFKIEIKHENV